MELVGFCVREVFSLGNVPRVRFTRHASNKFEFLRMYGFDLDRRKVIEAVSNPDRLDERSGQHLALKVLDEIYALRVVYEERNGYVAVITFYPVRRDRYGV